MNLSLLAHFRYCLNPDSSRTNTNLFPAGNALTIKPACWRTDHQRSVSDQFQVGSQLLCVAVTQNRPAIQSIAAAVLSRPEKAWASPALNGIGRRSRLAQCGHVSKVCFAEEPAYVVSPAPGNEQSLLESFGELREIAPGIDAVSFAAIHIVAPCRSSSFPGRRC
jgi:hypothetical protein